MFTQSDEALIKKALKGNHRAWVKLVRRFESDVFNYLIRMLGNVEDAKDLTQEVFISVYKSLQSFRGDSAFKTWLLKIARFRCVEFYRKHRVTADLDDTPEQLDDSVFSQPEEVMLMSQNNQQVIAAMASLSFTQREVVELKFFQYFTFDQIAEQTNESVNTVKTRFYAALKRLKTVLGEIND